MHVAKALLEPQHFFADDLEAKVPGLDDSGVDGTDRDLVHAIAGDPDERVILLAGLPFGRSLEIAAQRKAVDRPRCLPRPRALIVGIALHPDQIEGRTLHPVGDRKNRRQVGIARALVGQNVFEQCEAVGVAEHDAYAEAALAIAIVGGPQRH